MNRLASAIALLVMLRAPALASAEGPRRIALVEATTTTAPGSGLVDLRMAIASAVTRADLALVSPSLPASSLPECRPPACLARIAATTAAWYVLWVDARFEKGLYRISLELWDARSGERLGINNRRFAFATLTDFVKAGEEGTEELLASSLPAPAAPSSNHEGSENAGSISLPQPARSDSQTTPAAISSVAQRSGDHGTGPPRHTTKNALLWTGIAAGAAGLTSFGAGIYLMVKDGDPSCRAGEAPPCLFMRDTAAVGKPLLLAGGLATAAAVGLVVWSWSRPTTTVSMSTSGLRISGQF